MPVIDVQVHPFLNQRSENERVLSVGAQPLGHSVLLNQPQANRVLPPNRLLGQTADQYRRQ